jgi:modulator of FtsH protease
VNLYAPHDWRLSPASARGDGQSAVSLSLSIYLDAINIFLAVLQLLRGRRRD